MGFIGRFCEGYDDYYEYTDLESLDDVPEELLEQWDLRERLEEQQEWDDENE
jgi:hypothetical protein